MESKKDIRKRVLNRRELLEDKEWEVNSHLIYEKVITHSFFLNADIIYCFVDYRKEVCTRNLIKRAWELKKTVAVPKVDGQNMTFHIIKDFTDLAEGYMGIPEPITPCMDKIRPGLVIMPGVVFDMNRNRIGYGKGYYDRFLLNNTNLHTLAIAFELQLEDHIPSEPFDQKPEVLITEREIYV